ncbi:hypothetical protein BST61_g9737 [Cercospora zeina]
MAVKHPLPDPAAIQPAKWDLNIRLSALSLPILDRAKLESPDPGERNITVLNWAKCIRADGFSLFAIARVPFYSGETSAARRKKLAAFWAQQSEATRDYHHAIGTTHQREFGLDTLPGPLEEGVKEATATGPIHGPSTAIPGFSSRPLTPESAFQQTRYNLSNVAKRADVDDASPSLVACSGLPPSKPALLNDTSRRSPRNVQRVKDVESPLNPLSQPLASKIAELFEQSSRSATVPDPLPQSSTPQNEHPSVDSHWETSLSERLKRFGVEPLDAEKLRRLQPNEQDHYVSSWCSFTSKRLAGLKYLPVYTSDPSEIARSKTAYAWRERFWSTMSLTKREHFAHVVAELDQESKGVSMRFVRMITSELGAYVAMTAFDAGLAFPSPEFRHAQYKFLDLESIFGDPRANQLEKLDDCFGGEDQDLFNFHLFPMICEGVDTVATDAAVHHLVDLLWQGLQWEEKATWKEGAWWLKKQLQRNQLMALVKLLPCRPLDGSTDYHSMAETLLLRWAIGEACLGQELTKGDQKQLSIGLPGSIPGSTALLMSFPSTPEPATPTTDDMTNGMGKVSILDQDDHWTCSVSPAFSNSRAYR